MIRKLSKLGWVHETLAVNTETQDFMARLRKAWLEKELIVIENRHGILIYIIGVESKTIKFRDEVYIIVEDDGVPESILGDLMDLVDYMVSQKIELIGFAEIDDIESIDQIRRG